MKLYLGILLVFFTMACTSDFEEVNTDPNNIAEISPGTLLNPIIYEMATHNLDRSSSITFNLMQVALPFPSISGGLHRYDVSQNIGNSTWNNSYRWLNDIKEMLEKAQEVQDPNYEAIALTLNAWVYANLTDCFGDVPMDEASSGEEGNFYPAFNTQEEIYAKMLTDLENANALYDTSFGMAYAEDILFFNDVSLWQKFTNALHMRLLLRTSVVNTNAYNELAMMINNPEVYPLPESNEEGAVLQITGVTPNVSPWGRPQDFNLNRASASFFIDNLVTLNDPRLSIFAYQASDNDGNSIGYQGIPSAYDGSDDQFNYSPSSPHRLQVTNPMIAPILTYAEVEFIKAEVALYGYVGNAQTHYENAVQAAIEMWTEEDFDTTTYFSNPETAYNNTIEQLMLQKYYALYFTDYQQWFEYRRTGLPQLPTTTAMFNNAVMPSRFYYPTDVQISNTDNYNEAVQNMGGDDINTHVWWDN